MKVVKQEKQKALEFVYYCLSVDKTLLFNVRGSAMKGHRHQTGQYSYTAGQKTKHTSASHMTKKASIVLNEAASRERNNLLHSGPMLRKIPHPLI